MSSAPGPRPVLIPERGLLLAVEVREAVLTSECGCREEAARFREHVRIGGEGGDRAPRELRRLGFRRQLWCELHSLEPHEPRRDGDAWDAVWAQVVGHLLRELGGRVLDDLIESVSVWS